MLKAVNSQKSAFLFESVLNFCEDIITVKDLDFRIVNCNAAFLAHLNLENKSDVLGKFVTDLVDKDAGGLLLEKFNLVKHTGKTQKYLFKVIIDGETKYLKQSTNPIIKDDKLIGLVTVSRDVTEEEQLRRDMIRTNTSLNTLLEYIPINVYMRDKDRNYITGSKHAKEFVNNGIDLYSYPNETQIDIKAGAKETEEEDRFVLNNGQILRKEKFAFDFEGVKHWYRIVKAPILNKNDDVTGLVVMTKNIDAEKKLESQKDLFIATIVHDMKNPLLAQISSLKLLLNGTFGELKPEQKEILDLTLESSEYMKEMLFSLLATYKFDNGIITMDKSDVNVDKLMKTCIAEHKALASEHGIKMVYTNTLDDKNKILHADDKQIRRVISNLINNGLNYSDKGSEFRIKVYEKGDNAVFEFGNISPVIPKEVLDCIFDKYVTAASQYQKIGSGLGMYLSKKVVEAHNGVIYAHCHGKENNFFFELPLKDNGDNSAKIIW